MTDLGFEIARKTSYLLVEFAVQDGLGTAYRFTDYTADVTGSDGNTYTASPLLDVQLPPITGTLDSTPAVVTAKTSVSAFFSRISGGEPYPPVIVTISEAATSYASDYDGAGPYASEVVLFKGRMTRTVRNPGGREDAVRIDVQTIKGRLLPSLGIVGTPTCPLTFRQSPCGAEALAATQEVYCTISSIDGVTVTVSVAPTPGSPVSGDIYRFGSLLNEADGIEIGIEAWDSGGTTTEFQLRRPPPADWSGASVLVKPGCDKSAGTCNDRWAQIANFSGTLIKAPNWHPVYEAP